MRDIPSENVDSKIADILIHSWCEESTKSNNDFIKKYMYVASKIENVIIDSDAQALIKNFYCEIRSGYDSESSVIPITSRNLEALIRLTRAEAKLRLSNVATCMDVQRAINLMNKSRDEIYLNENGVFDSDRVECTDDSCQRDRFKQIFSAISSVKGGIDYSDLVLSVDLSKENLDGVLKEMMKRGSIFEPKPNHYNTIS